MCCLSVEEIRKETGGGSIKGWGRTYKGSSAEKEQEEKAWG